jgi:hypothetical protein
MPDFTACNFCSAAKMTVAILLIAVWTSGAWAGDTTARTLVADWKTGDREMAAVAALVAGAFASGMPWAGTFEGRPLYCPPPIGAFNGNQAMSILESFLAEHPEMADKTYGLARSASLRQAFPCAPTRE